jgi:hypothetical protein
MFGLARAPPFIGACLAAAPFCSASVKARLVLILQRDWRMSLAAGGGGRGVLAVWAPLSAQGDPAKAQPHANRITFTMIRSAARERRMPGRRPGARVDQVTLGRSSGCASTPRSCRPPRTSTSSSSKSRTPRSDYRGFRGDLESDANDDTSGTFVGRFNAETFVVAPGVAPAPKLHDPDAT